MTRGVAVVALIGVIILSSCGRKENSETSKANQEVPASQAQPAPAPPPEAQPAAAQPVGGPHAFVHLKDGSKVPGTIVASTQTDMVVKGDDGIERKIPLTQVKSVEYGEAEKAAATPAPEAPPRKKIAKAPRAVPPEQSPDQVAEAAGQPAPPPPPPVITKTYEVPSGSQVSVRTNETIDSGTAAEGQTFDAQVTRDVTDANGTVVIPSGSDAHIVIKSASKGGKFKGTSDLVLALQSVNINGRPYAVESADVTQKGKEGVGANKRTAAHVGGGAALGAIIGAIAGGGKGAAIGAGAGAGAGAITQVLTKGGAIKVPAESVLTFSLDKPLRVTSAG
jgi:hypothetical protein